METENLSDALLDDNGNRSAHLEKTELILVVDFLCLFPGGFELVLLYYFFLEAIDFFFQINKSLPKNTINIDLF